MTKDTFLHEWKGRIIHIGRWRLDSKPTKIINEDTKESVEYKNIEDAYENAILDNRSLKDIIAESNYEDLFSVTLDDSSIQILSPEEMKALGWDE